MAQIPKYTQVFILKILKCESCSITFQAEQIEIFVTIDEMLTKGERLHKEHKPLCQVPALIVIFDNAVVSSELLKASLLAKQSNERENRIIQ